jgi:hypothetical protein
MTDHVYQTIYALYAWGSSSVHHQLLVNRWIVTRSRLEFPEFIVADLKDI